MDRRAQLLQALKSLQTDAPVQVWPAIVKSVQGTNCTVDLIGTDLTGIDEVNLRADDEATEGVLLVPRVGSFVYVSAVENAVDNLFVCLVSEVDRVEVKIGKTIVTVDQDQVHAIRDTCELLLSDKASIKQDQTEITLSNGKATIKNAGVSLKDIFGDLGTLIQNLKVLTAQGPSTGLTPDTLASITQLNVKVNQLLQ